MWRGWSPEAIRGMHRPEKTGLSPGDLAAGLGIMAAILVQGYALAGEGEEGSVVAA